MDMQSFEKSIKKLVDLYGKPTDEKMDIYYDLLKRQNPKILERACELVMFHRISRFFPQPAEILEMTSQAYKEREEEEKPPEVGTCMNCHSVGIILKEYVYRGREYTMALACHCQEGKKYAKSFAINKVKLNEEQKEKKTWLPKPITEEKQEPESTPDPY